eukprot:jgi/Bigna1/135175/aug1.28_g9883
MCDISLEKGICLFDGRKVIAPDAMPPGVMARYTFDAKFLIDVSGNNNHGPHPIATSGPGRMGTGSSAAFQESTDYLLVPHSPTLLPRSELSVSMWVYIRDDISQSRPRREDVDSRGTATTTTAVLHPLVSKGTPADRRNLYFALSIDGASGKVVFNAVDQEVRSHAVLRGRQWYHVAGVVGPTAMLLYVNGVLDTRLEAKVSLAGALGEGSPLYIGGAPNVTVPHPLSLLIDDVTLYGRSLPTHEIEADSFPSLGPVAPSYVRLGCPLEAKCLVTDANKSCTNIVGPTHYHVCKQAELFAGGLAAAFNLGWIDMDTKIWKWEDANGVSLLPPSNYEIKTNELRGVALCCKGMVVAQ